MKITTHWDKFSDMFVKIYGKMDAKEFLGIADEEPILGRMRGDEDERAAGARYVRDAIASEFGENVASAIFQKVSIERHRNLNERMTFGDMKLLHEELLRPHEDEEAFGNFLPNPGNEDL